MTNCRYRAFISYSHADEQHGAWLQRALETYRVPRALVGKETSAGPIPRRLTPVFRDRNDLPAAGSLDDEIRKALSDSLFLIVICSPSVAHSRWVNEEIKFFKSLGRAERILAIIVDGEPGASAMPGREAQECFPPALRFRLGENGELTDLPAEPLAADARALGDGRRDALLKLVAGLIGVRLDDLVQRDAARRSRRARLAMGASAALVGIMSALTLVAVSARQEAQTMRGEAEDLIEFMLGDLRDKLEPVGKLDILQSVGDKALDYYEAQDLKRLDGEALTRRARALLLVGNIHSGAMTTTPRSPPTRRRKRRQANSCVARRMTANAYSITPRRSSMSPMSRWSAATSMQEKRAIRNITGSPSALSRSIRRSPNGALNSPMRRAISGRRDAPPAPMTRPRAISSSRSPRGAC